MKNIIINAAMEEVNLRGLRFTMQDLATRLKVSKRSLYENFSSKENLIDEMVDIILADMAKEEQEIYGSDAPVISKLEKLLTLHPYAAEMFNKNIYEDLRRLFPKQWEKVEASRAERQKHLQLLIEQGISEGIFRPVNVNLVGQVLKDAFDNFTSYSFLESNGLTYKKAMQELLDILFKGMLLK